MPVTVIQRRARELGRIRMGEKGAKGQPMRLETFRLTSADRELLQAAAARYGGEVRPWQGQPGQFELYTTCDELPCLIAPQEVSQWFELWSGGGCQRRCDGQYCTVAKGGGDVETVPCLCDPDERECKLTTRLAVMLHELPGVGTWRLETHGFYAATELPSSAEILVGLARQGVYSPVAIAIEERIVKRDGKTKKFPVPVIRIKTALASLMTGEVVQALPEAPRSLEAPKSVYVAGEGAESSGDRAAAQQQPTTREKMERAARAGETHDSYAGATIEGSASLAHPTSPVVEAKRQVKASLKTLGYPAPTKPKPILARHLDRELAKLSDISDEEWLALSAAFEQAVTDKKACFAHWKTMAERDDFDVNDRGYRLTLWSSLAGCPDTASSTGEFTPAEWAQLRTALETALNDSASGSGHDDPFQDE